MTHNPEATLGNDLEDFQRDVARVKAALGEVVVGQAAVVDAVLIGILAGGHVLLEGVPGVGKTLLVRQLSKVLGLNSARIQFTPDLMPADILGTTVIAEDVERSLRRLEFRRGPIFAHVVLADEINRATPKTQSALLEAMQERSVTVGSVTHPLEAPFFVLATENPIEMEGTYPLPEAQLDRFLMKINVPFPDQAELREILVRTTTGSEVTASPVLDRPRFLALASIAKQVPVADHVLDYVVRFVRATHPGLKSPCRDIDRFVRLGASPRGAKALLLASKIRAIVAGRLVPGLDDVKAMAQPTLRHRLLIGFEGQADGVTAERLIRDLVQQVPDVV
jgi:MoxR-like ATPase